MNPNNFHKIPYYIHIQYIKQALHILQRKEWNTYQNTKPLIKKTYLDKIFFKYDKRIAKYLNFFQFQHRSILAGVITNQTKTNEYYLRYNFKNPENYNHGKCPNCNQFWETLEHIIYICPFYTEYQQQFFQTITNEFPIYNNKKIISNFENIIFPWMNKTITKSVKNIPIKNPKYTNGETYNNTKLTIFIWTKLIKLLKHTQRDPFIYNKYNQSK